MANFGTDNPSSRSVRQDFLQRSSIAIRRGFQLPSLVIPGGAVTGLVPNGIYGGLAFERNSKTVNYSDGRGWYSLGNGGAIGQVVWQPLGTADNITGTTWPEVYERLQDLPRSRRVIILDTAGILAHLTSLPPDPFLIPAGVYNLKNTLLFANLENLIFSGGIRVAVEDGVKLNGLREINGPIAIEYRGVDIAAVPPVFGQTGACVDIDTEIDADSEGSTFTLDQGASIYCTESAPFIEFSNLSSTGSPGSVTMSYGSAIVFDNCPVISMLDSPDGTGVGVGLVFIDALTIIDGDTLRTLGSANTSAITTGGFKIIYEDPISFFGLPVGGVGGNFNTYFPSVDTGAILHLRISTSSNVTTQSLPPGVTNDDTQGFVNGDTWIDTSGAPDVYILRDNSTGAAIWGPPL